MEANEDNDRVSSISDLDDREGKPLRGASRKGRFRDNLKNRFPNLPTRNRGIYLLPNIVTTGALFAGFFAIVAGMNGQYVQASWSIFVASRWEGGSINQYRERFWKGVR